MTWKSEEMYKRSINRDTICNVPITNKLKPINSKIFMSMHVEIKLNLKCRD